MTMEVKRVKQTVRYILEIYRSHVANCMFRSFVRSHFLSAFVNVFFFICFITFLKLFRPLRTLALRRSLCRPLVSQRGNEIPVPPRRAEKSKERLFVSKNIFMARPRCAIFVDFTSFRLLFRRFRCRMLHEICVLFIVASFFFSSVSLSLSLSLSLILSVPLSMFDTIIFPFERNVNEAQESETEFSWMKLTALPP